MKKWNILWIAGAVLLAAGCQSPEAEVPETTKEITVETESQRESGKDPETTETTGEPVSETVPELIPETSAKRAADDNFSVEEAKTEAFARLIKEAAAGKDLETLAELAAFPLYVGFSDGGVSVETKEDFLALGTEKIFTTEWVDSILRAEEKDLPPSMAGFVLSGGKGQPNVVFGLRDGELAVLGINY